jgi:membrane-associated protease RseP (regulator of RpoE activity)
VDNLLPRSKVFPASLPSILEKLASFTMSFSVALAILNMAPIWQLDGGWAFPCFLQLLFPLSSSTTHTTITNYTFGGTLLLFIVNCLLSIRQVIRMS